MDVKVETKLVLFLDIAECGTTLKQATMSLFLVRWSCEFLELDLDFANGKENAFSSSGEIPLVVGELSET